MSATTEVRAALLASGAVTAEVGSKIMPPPLTQDTALPAIVIYLAAEDEGYHLRGANDYPRSRVTVECHATRYSEADALGETVIEALKNYGSASGVSIQKQGLDVATYEDDFQTARRIIDFIVWRRT